MISKLKGTDVKNEIECLNRTLHYLECNLSNDSNISEKMFRRFKRQTEEIHVVASAIIGEQEMDKDGLFGI